MSQKILTVSIAAYNVSKFIRKALDSLIVDEAYLQSLEVIIVNDGSTDDTASIAQEYRKKYPQTFRVIDKENGGYGSTINVSLAVAAGKYYKLLDGDDWYDKNGLCELIDYLKETSADLVINPYYEVKRSSKVVHHHLDIPKEETDILSLHLDDRHFQMHGITVKTDRLKRYNHPITEHCFYTDIEYVFYCLVASNTVSRFDQPVYNYRMDITGQSVSLAGIQKHYREHMTVTDRICRCYKEECGVFSGGKREIIDHAVTFNIYGVFNGYMVLKGAGKHKKELMAFDKRLEEKYPTAHKAGDASNVVRITWLLRFHLYWLLCGYMKLKFGGF